MAKLTQEEADTLIALAKDLKSRSPIAFPPMRSSHQVEAQSSTIPPVDFVFDIQRKTLNPAKCTYNTRSSNVILIRVDIKGPPHGNPDGEEVPCPHIHIYREGYGDKWAYPLENHITTDTSDLVSVLISFLEYNNVTETPEISEQGGSLV